VSLGGEKALEVFFGAFCATMQNKILRDVARKANEDQRSLIREYEKVSPETAP
jgi:hypothetical protein